jgi:hypothetical protein
MPGDGKYFSTAEGGSAHPDTAVAPRMTGKLR